MNVVSPDLANEAGYRLGRLFGAGQATLWARATIDGATVSVNAATPLPADAAPTSEDAAAVAIRDTSEFEFLLERSGIAATPFTARAHLAGRGQVGDEAAMGQGQAPFLADLAFRAYHAPVRVRQGRLEVFGLIEARVRTDAGETIIVAPGKAHEQRGPRPRFGPAFTYLSLVGPGGGLLAVQRADGHYGFAWLGDECVPLADVKIASPGLARRFAATLIDGRRIDGVARLVRTSSETVEGKRRPGSTVAAESEFGPLTGQLNDWSPDP